MTTSWHGIRHSSGELLSYTGAVLLHDNPREIEFLIPTALTVALPGRSIEEVAHRLGRPVLLLRDHPDLKDVQWPLNPRDFW